MLKTRCHKDLEGREYDPNLVKNNNIIPALYSELEAIRSLFTSPLFEEVDRESVENFYQDLGVRFETLQKELFVNINEKRGN